MAATETPTEVRAEARWVRISPRKARLVTDHIRGRSVPEARTVLAFTTRAAAREVEKVLKSAVANAEANHGLIGDDLLVSSATVDEGPTIKRWRPRARGRVARIKKRTCHITVRLAPEAQSGLEATPIPPEPKAAAEETPKPTPKRTTRVRKTGDEETAGAAAETKLRKRTTTRRKKEAES